MLVADPRSTPTCHSPQRMTPIKTARDARRSRALGSSNLPVPTIYSLSQIHFSAGMLVADPRSTPTCHPPQRMTPIKTARGARRSRALGSSNLPVPTIYSLSQIHFSAGMLVADPRSAPTCHPPQRMTPIKTARDARRSRALGSSNLPVPTIKFLDFRCLCRCSSPAFFFHLFNRDVISALSEDATTFRTVLSAV